ncbi:hypothetical protein PRIPAC_91226 [Pristionchus pacificus]|uniref:Uncharacterized protein n=1 Tax=Pristionchus pacificus TaxID=54126 RepID=A0A2A6B7Y8_PRIPA|nr:hypothetical protein PRIPAC_91226 [Pristionchus pacificus]|eukprot:PDM61981.1 hypothetical protein PRIPAC_51423 [Pristionchus pacificus]
MLLPIPSLTAIYSTGLGSLSIECEKIASEKTTVCTSQPSIPRCDGQLEGCTGSQWLGGVNIFEVENATKAVLMDPICCSSSEVRVVPGSCIHDNLNGATQPFDHSLVEDLFYRGFQCWHQTHQSNQTLVDLIWKVETCAFESELFPPIDNEPLCEECRCDCGPHLCDGGEAPIKVTHKKKMGECECECSCNFKCL